MNIDVSELAGGINAGILYSAGNATEKEINRGGNYYMSAVFAHTEQMASLGSVISRLAEAIITNASTKSNVLINCNIAPLYCIPISLYLAAVKLGKAGDFGKWANSKLRFTLFPERLGNRTVKVLSFCAEHYGDFTRVAMVTGSVALIALGNYAFAVPTLVFMGYQVIDQRGWVPYRISHFMERYMPLFSAVAGIVGGTDIVRVITVYNLIILSVPQSIKWFLYEKIDWVGRKIFGGDQSRSIQAFATPWTENRKLSFQEINAIVDAPRSSFELDPAHCSKWTQEQIALPEDRHYDKFLTLFDRINWTTKYPLLQPKLRVDDRFQEFLREKHPGIPNDELKNRFDDFMVELGRERNQTKEQFAAAWLREQMVQLVDALCERKRAAGLQSDLEDAMKNFSKILPYIEALERAGLTVDLEDTLKEIGINGGYCSRGLRLTANDIIPQVIAFHTSQGAVGPNADYETKIKQSLQLRRKRILQNMFRRLVDTIRLPDAMTQDIHGFDIYLLLLSFGFHPLTENDKRTFSLIGLGLWELYSTKRNEMMDAYLSNPELPQESIDAVFQENGEVNFGVHIANIINESTNLSEENKEAILEKYTSANNGEWNVELTNERFHQLFLVMIGILRKRQNPPQRSTKG